MHIRQSNLIIRVEANPECGTQLVNHMMILGKAWQDKLHGEGNVSFACQNLPGRLEKRIRDQGFRLLSMSSDPGSAYDAAETSKNTAAHNADWIVVSGDEFQPDYFQHLSLGSTRVLHVCRDHCDKTHNVDLVLDQKSLTVARQSKTIPIKARRVLVQHQGDSPDCWTLSALQILSDMNHPRLIVDCLIDRRCPVPSQIETFKKSANLNLRIHRTFDRFENLIPQADLAISNQYSGCYQLASHGIPTVGLLDHINCQSFDESINSSSAIIFYKYDRSENSDVASSQRNQITRSLRHLMNHREKRQQMASAALLLNNNNEAKQIVQTMRSHPIRIRSTRIQHHPNDLKKSA